MPSVRADPLEQLIIPDGTHVEEHDLVADGDVIVGGQSTVEFGVRGHTVIAGERVRFEGHIEADGDCRLDMWSVVEDNVLVGEDAYLGERVEIDGELKVAGDLDIGDDVDIADGFEANGWIVIRNPMPTIVFLFVYLSQLLRIGEEEAAERVLARIVEEGDRETQPVVVPRGARVGDDAWRVSTPARIGDDCRLHGNVRAESLVVGHDNVIFGGLRTKGDLTVGGGTEIAGNVTSGSGAVAIGPGAAIRGDVAGESVEVHSEATVEGAIRARTDTTMVDEPVLTGAVVGDDTVATPDVEAAEADSVDGDGTLADDSPDAADGETGQAPTSGSESESGDEAATPASSAEAGASETDDTGDRTNGHDHDADVPTPD